MYRKYLIISVCCVIASLSGCATSSDIFDDIGENIASPSAMAIDVASNRLYLVNSNDRVLYDWHQGNFQALDITDPLAPVLLKSVGTDAFSGEIYLDTTSNQAFVPNRFSENTEAVSDRLYTFSVDESVPDDFLSYSQTAAGRDSYAIACCYPANRSWITTSLTELDYIDITSDLSPTVVSIAMNLSNGGTISDSEVYHIVLKDNQALLTRTNGGLMILGLDKADGTDTGVLVDYFINDVGYTRGIAIDGDTVYVVGEGDQDGWKRYLLVLDVSSLTPRSGNDTTLVVDKEDSGILTALIEVGNYPQEVVLSTDYAFVTNMDDNTVAVIDRASNTFVTNINVGLQPFAMAIYTTAGGEDKYLYVGNLESNTISIVDIATLAVVATYQ